MPVPAGRSSSHSTHSWSPAGGGGIQGAGEIQGEGSGHSTCSWDSAGPEGQWAWGRGLEFSELCDRLRAGVRRGLVVGILVVVGLVQWPRGGYSSMVWVSGLEAGAAEGQVSHRVWVWHRAVAWHSLRGGELCRPMGWGFCRPAVLLLDSGVEKPSTI
jgi:hypothetical protein